jgi:hypothetical protein
MKIKILAWALVLSGILIVVLAVIAFLKPATKAVSVEVPAQEIRAVFAAINKTQTILEGMEFPTRYIIVEGKDTTVVDSNTLYKDVPVVATAWDSSFTISINKQIFPVDYYQEVIAKGEVFEVTFGLYQAEFNVEMAKPSNWDFDLLVVNGIDEDRKWHGALVTNLWYKKFALSPQVRIEPVKREEDTEYQIKYVIDFVYEIL